MWRVWLAGTCSRSMLSSAIVGDCVRSLDWLALPDLCYLTLVFLNLDGRCRQDEEVFAMLKDALTQSHGIG
jgi:hypothetical protein